MNKPKVIVCTTYHNGQIAWYSHHFYHFNFTVMDVLGGCVVNSSFLKEPVQKT